MPREASSAADDVEVLEGYAGDERRPFLSFVPSTLFVMYLFALPVYSLLRAFEVTHTLQLMTFVIPVLLAALSVAHMIGTRGPVAAAAMSGAALAITCAAEAFGSSTGLLFGNYYYTDTLGPKVFGLVPWLIPVAWLGMLYPARGTVDFLFGFGSRPAGAAVRIALSALALTAWDLSLDPRMVGDGHWVWIGGGAYFGIPLSNFLGWWLAGSAVFAVWEWIDRRAGARAAADPLPDEAPQSAPLLAVLEPRLLPVLAYIAIWLGESMANVLFWSGPAVGAIVFVAMGAFGAPALAKLIRRAGVVPRLQRLWA